ncbi:MAG: hypothetical protein AAB332_07385 [Planctomycetota bacterium]
MNEKRQINHAQRVGKVANLVIFLGILGIILSILALTVSQGLAQRGYGFGYIMLGLFMMGLGYGIRYRCGYSLYAAVVLFIVLSGSFLFRFLVCHTAYVSLRLALCAWVSFRLVQALPSMRALIITNTFPERNNRFMRFFLRRKHQ